VATNLRCKFNLEKIAHFNQVWEKMGNNIVLVLASTVVHRIIQALARTPFPYPELVMEVFHEERGKITASLLPSELPVRITIELVRRAAEVNKPKEIDCQGGYIKYYSGLLATVM
jgi:hypothetical protein